MAHIHNIIDPDVHFIIDPDTRDMEKETSDPLTLMQCDHDSERVTFEIPRYVEGHDMLLCDEILLYYTNTGTAMGSSRKTTNYGFYKIEDIEPLEDDSETLVGSWLISQNATLLAGSVTFQIKFSCLEDNATGNTTYIWQTNQCGGIEVLASITNTASVIDLEPDAFLSLKAMVNELGIESVEQTVTAEGDEAVNVITITQPNGKQWTFQVRNGSRGPMGVSGVYVGSGEMPEEYNVQIDPSAEESTLVADLYAKLSELTDKYDALRVRVDYAEQDIDNMTLRNVQPVLTGSYYFNEKMVPPVGDFWETMSDVDVSFSDGHASDMLWQITSEGYCTIEEFFDVYIAGSNVLDDSIGAHSAFTFHEPTTVSAAFYDWFVANTTRYYTN